MNQKNIILVILILAIVGGGAFLYKKYHAGVSQNQTSQQAVCNTGYSATPESKVVSEQSATLITGFEKKCDGNWYVTFDYLGAGQGSQSDIENGTGSYYTNTNTQLRTFKIDSNLKVKLANEPVEIALMSYLSNLIKLNHVIFNQSNAYVRNSSGGQPVFLVVIKNGIVILMDEQYIP